MYCNFGMPALAVNHPTLLSFEVTERQKCLNRESYQSLLAVFDGVEIASLKIHGLHTVMRQVAQIHLLKIN